MPLGSNIWLFMKSIIQLERDDYGVYELLDHSDGIIYIGCGKIRCYLMEHFGDGKSPIIETQSFSVEYTWDEAKSKNRQQEELKKYYKTYNKYPKFNR
jgi:hypothetical protein